MVDVERLFRTLDELDAPVAWPDVERRHPGTPPPEGGSGRRILATVVALAVAFAGIAIAVRAFRHAPSQQTLGSPRNGRIAFVETDEPGRGPWSVAYVEPDGSGWRLLTAEPGRYGEPAWSPDGSKLALTLTVGTRTSRIATMNGDGSGLTEFTHCGPPECLSDTSPAWAPDGSRIAWARVSGADAVIPESIFVQGGERPTLALPGLAFVGGLTWAPDGNAIAFAARERGQERFSIYVVDVGDGSVARLTDCPASVCPVGDLHPSWSPDGSSIVFARDDDLYVMNADGSDVGLLYSCGPSCTAMQPVWSPDGTEVAFAVETNGQRDLFVMAADGSDVRRLTDTPVDESSPTWQSVGATGPIPSPSGMKEPAVGRCVQVETAGDFDGDGLRDRAVLFDEIPAEETCLQDVSSYLRIEVRFGSGDRFAAPLRYCDGGTCGGVFTSTDLDADGHDELAIDVGPGAAVAFVEFFRVDTDGIHPLVIQAPADRPFVKPGGAVLGGGFDSLSQSPVECRVGSDGDPELVSIHAEATGDPSTDPWLVHQTTMVLHGDRLVVTSTSEKAQPWSMTWTLFLNDCT
jgi:WD40-like Beta Propeller Repeat